jgi:organic radical activating enzyme
MNQLDTIEDPNFSIVLPGPCNANCGFCFWERSKNELPFPQYMARLDEVLSSLPDQFHQISITGGEPTISPYLSYTLKTLSKYRDKFNKIVLTTNGYNLVDCMEGPDWEDLNVIDYLNISKHSFYENDDAKCFNIKSPILIEHDLLEITTFFNQNGIKVNANCVLAGQFDDELLIKDYIQSCKDVGMSSVCFRHQHYDGCSLEPQDEELWFMDYKVIYESRCPVCRSSTMIIDGMPVTWKASIPEPSEGLDLVYECVFHPDGTLSADWGKNTILHTEG